jgi:hypothetical protein
MNITFVGKLCGSCYARDADADRADIWVGMATLLDAVKNDFFFQKDGGETTEEYYIEASNMLEELVNFCSDCHFEKPKIKSRVEQWLERFANSPEPDSKDIKCSAPIIPIDSKRRGKRHKFE